MYSSGRSCLRLYLNSVKPSNSTSELSVFKRYILAGCISLTEHTLTTELFVLLVSTIFLIRLKSFELLNGDVGCNKQITFRDLPAPKIRFLTENMTSLINELSDYSELSLKCTLKGPKSERLFNSKS